MMSSDEEKDREERNEVKDLSQCLEAALAHAGEMGRYQWFLFIFMWPLGFGWAFAYFGQMFLTATPREHWCRVPELERLPLELGRNLSIPGAIQGSDWDRCRMYQANWDEVLQTLTPPPLDTPTIPCTNGWHFNYDDIPYPTVVSEREWVCDKDNLVPWAQTICFCGTVLGAIVFGRLADRYGRVPVLVASNLCGFLGGIGSIFTIGFWDFALCRFFVGLSFDSCFHMIYILAMEYVGIKHRTWVANISIALYFGGGCLALPYLALWLNNWQHLSIVMSIPMALVVAAPFCVLESARWLISRGRIEDAKQIIQRLEEFNKSHIPPNIMDDLEASAKLSPKQDSGLSALFKTKTMISITVLLTISFMCVSLIFDVLVRLSETLGGDFFVTFALTSATEIPSLALLVLLLDRFGRRTLVFGTIGCAGLLSLVNAFILSSTGSVGLAVSARFFINMTYNTMIQWSPELMPTAVRSFGSSLVHGLAFSVTLVSPFVVYSGIIASALPLLIVAVIAAVGGLVAITLPETMSRPIPQTLDDVEELASTSKFIRLITKKSKKPRDSFKLEEQ